MNWWLALMASPVLPLILLATPRLPQYVRESYRRIRTAIARINAFSQGNIGHVCGAASIARSGRSQDFSP